MRKETRSILLFCLLAFLPVWLGCLVIAVTDLQFIPGAMLVLFALFMFVPALASLLVRLIRKEGFTHMLLRPRIRGNVWRYVLALLLPGVLSALGGAVYFLFYPELFDPSASVIAAQIGDARLLWPTIIGQALMALLLGGFINGIPALGEELGWRGYLLPRLCRIMSARKATLVSGAIWGVWHAPMIALGHNYGTAYPLYPWSGILMMTVFCVLFGAFLSYLALRTGSAIPCALSHGALNAIASLPALFSFAGYEALWGPMPMGGISMLPTLVCALFCLRLIKRLPLDNPPAIAAE